MDANTVIKILNESKKLPALPLLDSCDRNHIKEADPSTESVVADGRMAKNTLTPF